MGRLPALLVMGALLVGCTGGDEDPLLRALLVEANPDPLVERVPASPDRIGERLELGPAPGREILGEFEERKKGKCYWSLTAFVRDDAGSNCNPLDADLYRAEIGAWSHRCVGKCNDRQRLAEAHAVASRECRRFCSDKGCPVSIFTLMRQCGSSSCGRSKSCSEDWPLMNSCGLLQAAQMWNCHCNVPPPLPPLDDLT